MRKYEFNWGLIGDIEDGRPNLGKQIDLDVYRLMHFTLRDAVEERFGTEETNRIFYEAGRKAGKHFFQRYIAPVASIEEFVSKVQMVLREKSIGILKIEEALLDKGTIMLTIDEDIDCSGLPELDYETCIYDEGFVAALLEGVTMKPWTAKEIDCWTTGARTCRFVAKSEF